MAEPNGIAARVDRAVSDIEELRRGQGHMSREFTDLRVEVARADERTGAAISELRADIDGLGQALRASETKLRTSTRWWIAMAVAGAGVAVQLLDRINTP